MYARWRSILATFDASSMIYAWDNYPVDQFPPLWDWVTSEIERDTFSIPSVAFDEVNKKTPDCGQWLKDAGISLLSVTNEVLQEAMRIKKLLQIQEDRYHPNGVGENDILIIATASIMQLVLISNEARQITLPLDPARKKIPAVCADPEVAVDCIDFITLVKRSRHVFR